MKGPDEGRDHRSSEATHRHRPLHRHHGARHHRRRAAQPDRQPPGDHAGHREAPRSLRAPRRTASWCFRAAPARPRKSSTCSACCSIRATREQPLPLILTGPAESAALFRADPAIHRRARSAPRRSALSRSLSAIPPAVARELVRGTRAGARVAQAHQRFVQLQLAAARAAGVPAALRSQRTRPCAALELHRDQPVHLLAANLRRAFSGIVAGNVKEYGIRAIERHGPFELRGDRAIVGALDKLLRCIRRRSIA